MIEILNLKSTFRSLSRNPLFSIINVLGFSLSLTLVILLGAYARHELTTDDFQHQKERIYLYSTMDDAYSPPAMAPYIRESYPDVEAFTRLYAQNIILMRQNEKIQTSMMTVDSTFFDIFSYPLLQGERDRVLKGDRNEIVISESYARKVFGDENPIGKQFTCKYVRYSFDSDPVELTHHLTVGGVMEDMENTLFNSYDVLMNINAAGNIMGSWMNEGWESGNHLTVLLMKGDKNPNEYHDDLLRRFKEVYWLFKDNKETDFKFTPLREAYFDKEVNMHVTTRKGGSMKEILTFLGAGLAILIFAIINYINLTLARSSERARELATCRLLGSPRSHLLWKLIVESVLLCVLSFVIAIFLVKLLTPFFMNLMEITDPLFSNLSLTLLTGVVVGILLIGVLSGIFPALVITNFTPLDVVRGTFVRKTRQVYSKVLIGFQYGITLLLLICAYVIFAQTGHLRNEDKGFDNRNLIYFSNQSGISAATLGEEMRKISGVRSFSAVNGSVVERGNNNTFKYDEGELISMQSFVADSAIFDVINYDIIRRFDSDTLKRTGIWINEALYNRLNLPADENVFYTHKGTQWEQKIVLAGVVRNFRYGLPKNTPAMVVVHTRLDAPWSYMLRYEGGDAARVMDEVKATFTRVSDGYPFKGGFVDAEMDSWYNAQERTGKIVSLMALVAILIATLGMLAMASFFIRQRENEIAIRKAYGSGNGELMMQLQKHFILLIGIAFVVAAPIAYWVMRHWLSGFENQVPLSPIYFILPLLGVLLMAIDIIFHLGRKAIHTNPAETLRK